MHHPVSGLENPWTEEPVGQEFTDHKVLDTIEQLSTAAHRRKQKLGLEAGYYQHLGPVPHRRVLGQWDRTDLRGVALKPLYLRVNRWVPRSLLNGLSGEVPNQNSQRLHRFKHPLAMFESFNSPPCHQYLFYPLFCQPSLQCYKVISCDFYLHFSDE